MFLARIILLLFILRPQFELLFHLYHLKIQVIEFAYVWLIIEYYSVNWCLVKEGYILYFKVFSFAIGDF